MADISLRIRSDFEQAERDFKDLEQVSESTRKKIEKFSQSFKTEQIDKFIDRNRMSAIAVSATSGKMAGMQREAAGLQRQIQTLISKGLSPESKEIQKLQKEYISVNKEIDKSKKSVNGLSDAFTAGVKKVVAYAAAYLSFRAVTGIFKSFITEAAKLEDVTAAFTPLMGGVDKATELVSRLNKEAATTPFEFEAISATAKQLLPVMNKDIEKTADTFRMLGDTAGGNAQKLESITRGYTKAMLKQKVDMESLNMIAEAGVPIYTELASSMGVSVAEMIKMSSAGKITSDDLTNAFKQMTSEGGIFFNGMEIASKTFNGQMSTMRDNLKMAAASVGKVLLPSLTKIVGNVSKIAAAFTQWANTNNNLERTLKIIGNIIAVVGPAILAYIVYVKAAAAVTKLMEIAQAALNLVMRMNTIGLVIAGLVALIAIGVLVYKNWETVKKIGVAAFQYLALTIQIIGQKIKVAFFKIVQTVINGLMFIFKPFFFMIDKVIMAFNKITGKNIPLLSASVTKFANGFDKNIAKAQRRIASLEKQRAAAAKRLADATKKAGTEITKAGQKLVKSAVANTARINEQHDSEIKKLREKGVAYKDALEQIQLSQSAVNRKQIEEATKFFEERAELEGVNHETRIEYLRSQQAQILELSGITAQERLNTEKALARAIANEEKKMFQTKAQFMQYGLSTTADMLRDLQTVFKNAGKESRELAILMRAVAIGEATINSYLAFTKALAAFPPPLNYVAAGITLAAGLAKVAAISTTPLPTAQTGGAFTVPDTPAARHDGYGVMASPGEKVTVEPRGESSGKDMFVNIQIDGDTMFRLMQRGVDTGKVNVNNKNIGNGVFAR